MTYFIPGVGRFLAIVFGVQAAADDGFGGSAARAIVFQGSGRLFGGTNATIVFKITGPAGY